MIRSSHEEVLDEVDSIAMAIAKHVGLEPPFRGQGFARYRPPHPDQGARIAASEYTVTVLAVFCGGISAAPLSRMPEGASWSEQKNLFVRGQYADGMPYF